MKRLSLVLLSASLLNACVSERVLTQSSPDLPSHRTSILVGAPIGVATLETRSDVVQVHPGVQHVFYPNNTIAPLSVRSGTARTSVAPSNRPIATPAAAPIATPNPQPHPFDVQSSPPTEAERMNAWLKHCQDSPAMTSRDWEIVTTTAMPAELTERWQDHCVEGS